MESLLKANKARNGSTNKLSVLTCWGFISLPFDCHTWSLWVSRTANNPNKFFSERKYRQTEADKDFCPNKEAFFFLWWPHVLDNHLLTVGPEFIRLDAEICIPCVVKEFGAQRQILLQLDITSIPEAYGQGASQEKDWTHRKVSLKWLPYKYPTVKYAIPIVCFVDAVLVLVISPLHINCLRCCSKSSCCLRKDKYFLDLFPLLPLLFSCVIIRVIFEHKRRDSV